MATIDWATVRTEMMAAVGPALPPKMRLPILPEPLLRFNRRSGDPNAPVAELAKILDQDASLVAELLKTVNGAALGLRKKVTSTQQALALLGVKRVKMQVLAGAVERQAAAVKSPLVFARLFARSNLERAVFARLVAERIKADADVAFAAGLMQDFLLPVLTCDLLLLYTGIVERLAKGGADLAERERAALGWDHAEAAAHVMLTWGFPDELICGVRLHHMPQAVTADARLKETAVAAAALASLLPDPVKQSPDGPERLVALCRERYGIDAIEFARTVDERIGEQAPPSVGDTPLVQRIEQAVSVMTG